MKRIVLDMQLLDGDDLVVEATILNVGLHNVLLPYSWVVSKVTFKATDVVAVTEVIAEKTAEVPK